jgi:AraC family transcriptional regulator
MKTQIVNPAACMLQGPRRMDTFLGPDHFSRAERHPPSGSSATIHDRALARQKWNEQAGSTGIAIKLLHQATEALNGNRTSAAEFIDRAVALLYADQGRTGVAGPAATAGHKQGGLAPWQMSKVANYVDAMLASTIMVSDCARLAGLSASHFSRGFKASFGQTLIGYVVRRRTERTKQLMILTDESLCQIALTCGFTDQSHLSRWFTRLEGVTPAVWRRQRRGRSPASLPI